MGANIQRSRQGTSRRRQRQVFSDINVTPLVDVMLVLLVVFMVTAPMMTVGIPVDLPKSDGTPREDKIEPIIVSINAKGELFLQDSQTDMHNLIEKLKGLVSTASSKERPIYVRGDNNISYGNVVDVMAAIAAAGFDKVSLMTELATKEDLLKKNPTKTVPGTKQPGIVSSIPQKK